MPKPDILQFKTVLQQDLRKKTDSLKMKFFGLLMFKPFKRKVNILLSALVENWKQSLVYI